MSALSLISQFQTLPLVVGAGLGPDGILDNVFNDVLPVGTYIGLVSLSVVIAGGVTDGEFTVANGVTTIATVAIPTPGTLVTCSFFYTSNGVSALAINIVGNGAAWTSLASVLSLRQIA